MNISDMSVSKQPLLLIVGMVMLAAAVFALDLGADAGTAVGVLYLLIVILALKLPKRRYAILAATYCTILVVFAAFAKGYLGWRQATPEPLMLNGMLVLFALWTTAVFAYGRQAIERSLLRAKQD